MSLENNKGTTRNTDEMVTISRAEYENMQAQIDWLTEQLTLSKKKQFGSSTEKASEQVMEQMSLLFNEAEIYADKQKEREETEVKAHVRRKHSGSVRDIVPDDLAVEIVEHRLDEENRICEQCGTVMKEIGSESVETLVIVPAKAYIRRDVYYTYACMSCKENELSTPIKQTPKEKTVIPGGFASAEAVSYIATQKFVMYSPLYRQEQEWKRQGIQLSRQTMSNWLVRCAEEHLTPVYEELHKQLLCEDIIHADETKVQVLKKPDKKAQSDSFMWLYRSGKCAKRPIVLYEYQPSRGGQNPKNFLSGFKGYLQTDGYAGYNTVEDVVRVGCWAHARRKFDEAVQALPKGIKTGAAVTGEAYCSRLFQIEKELEELSPEERYTQRQAQAKPVLDAFLTWAETRAAAPKSKLGQAFTYLKGQWPNLVNYLQDGRIEISNNRAERSIKPFVMRRKNFLFANTPSGAKASAVIYSLIETAKESNLDPYRYLCYVLKTAPMLDRTVPDWVLPLLPENAPIECKA